MADFYFDSIARTDKTNKTGVEAGQEAKYVDAGDWNNALQDMRDLRGAIAATWKKVVRCATTADDGLSGLAARDGVTPVAGDRVLVKAQSAGAANGIYVAASGAWTRATDADSSAKVTSGLVVWVSEGTTQQNTLWGLTTDDPITLGSTSLTFAQVGGATRAFGEISQQINVSGTTISDTTNFFLVTLSAPALSGLESQFDNPSGHRLRYTGTATKTFAVSAEYMTTGGSTLPSVIMFQLRKNGSALTKSENNVRVPTSTGEHGACQVLVSLATNDYIELYVRNFTAISNVTVTYLNLRATEA